MAAQSIKVVAASASNWTELHESLESVGAAYNKKGKGARIALGPADARASDVSRELSLAALVLRFGPFEPDSARVNLGFEAYRQAFQQQLDSLRADRTRDCERLIVWSAAVTGSIGEHVSPMVRRAIKEECKVATRSLEMAYKEAISICTKARLTHEQWHRAGKPDRPPSIIVPALILPRAIFGDENAVQVSGPFTRQQVGWRQNTETIRARSCSPTTVSPS